MKHCHKCGTTKLKTKFSKDKNTKDKLSSTCKKCVSILNYRYFKTKDGLISRMYGSQRSNSKKRGDIPPAYTKQDLRDWLYSQKKFHHLFHLWEVSNYDKMLVPSVDRLNDYEPYTFSNIQLMTWIENKNKGEKDKLDGINNKQNRAIIQFSIDGDFIKEYYSLAQAGRELSISRASIRRCCQGKAKSACGFRWKYK